METSSGDLKYQRSMQFLEQGDIVRRLLPQKKINFRQPEEKSENFKKPRLKQPETDKNRFLYEIKV